MSMRWLLLLSLISATAGAAQAQTVNINLDAPVTMSGGNNQLLDGYPWGGGAQQTLSSTGERQVYVPQGIIQNPDGSATLQAQPNANTSGAWPLNLPYTSGGFSTASYNNGEPATGGFTALYGYFQMTAQLPLGSGLWPAFWLEPVNGKSACEIDIFEAPFNNPSLIQSSLHDGGTGYTTGQVTVPNYSSNYNTYGVNWSPTTITYYVNGQETGSTPTPASCNTPAYILANLAVGGTSWAWSGVPNSSNAWPANMNIKSITYNPNGPPGGSGGDGGTYSGGLAGGAPSAGTTPGQPIATTPAPTTPAGGAPAGTTPGTQAPNQIAQVVPSGGSVTDCSSNTWAITADNRITENGKLVPGGGDTSALMLDGCTIYGLSNGENGSKVGWFSMSNVSPNGDQYWNYLGPSAVPPNIGSSPTASPSPSTGAPATAAAPPPATGALALGQASQYACTTAAPNSAAAHGGFATINGVIYQPDGKPWVARGPDIHDFGLNGKADALPSLFPGLNMVRVAIESLNDNPADYAAAVQSLTSKGIVVEFSDYTNTTGRNSGGSDGSVYTGALLAQENAMYAAFAGYYKNNPYVWLGTDNEPATTGGSLSDWHLSNYQAIRGAGNTAPILLDPSGSRPPGYGGTPEMSGLNPANYANMENIIWDPHVYPYQAGYTTDQATANAEVAATIQAMQTIHGLDGPPPVIIGEYGPDVSVTNPSDAVTLSAVQHNQTMGGSGATAWAVDGVATYQMTSGGGLNAWGQNVAAYTAGSGATGCNITAVPTLVPTTATVQAPTTAAPAPAATGPAATTPSTAAAGAQLIPQTSLSGIQAPAGMN